MLANLLGVAMVLGVYGHLPTTKASDIRGFGAHASGKRYGYPT